MLCCVLWHKLSGGKEHAMREFNRKLANHKILKFRELKRLSSLKSACGNLVSRFPFVAVLYTFCPFATTECITGLLVVL